jgi:predicted nuclease of restriction endonuclease-like (RecB) superfamily
LTVEFGQAFSLRSLYRAIQFCQGFTNQEIVSTLSTQLSWSHFIELLPIKDPLARDFYAEMCRIERWDVRTLRQKIGGLLFQRTALSKKPQDVIAAEIGRLRDGQMSPDIVFRDPYLLDLLGLKGAYSERDLESAILREIEGVLLELGSGFAFVARQKRMSVGKDDFHLDLLFFHRHLRRLIAVELKLESFQPAHVGQMELYLRWLDKHERAPGEEAPIGLILCASADAEQVELLQLDAKSIRVSEYLTELPPLPLLRERLHQAIEHARESAARRAVVGSIHDRRPQAVCGVQGVRVAVARDPGAEPLGGAESPHVDCRPLESNRRASKEKTVHSAAVVVAREIKGVDSSARLDRHRDENLQRKNP